MKRSNIVTILIDDMGWADRSYCGSNFYESPTLDRLRERNPDYIPWEKQS